MKYPHMKGEDIFLGAMCLMAVCLIAGLIYWLAFTERPVCDGGRTGTELRENGDLVTCYHGHVLDVQRRKG